MSKLNINQKTTRDWCKFNSDVLFVLFIIVSVVVLLSVVYVVLSFAAYLGNI